jgi:hypothetical protein
VGASGVASRWLFHPNSQDVAYLLIYLLGGTLGHDDDRSKPATPNQFGKRRIDGSLQSAQVLDSEIWTTERFLGCPTVATD